MKARVKDTGEVIDVVFALHPNPAVDEVYWWCEDNRTEYHKIELDFMGEDIDWEQRRYEIARDVMAAYISNDVYSFIDEEKTLAKWSVVAADVLIKELLTPMEK